MLKYSSKSVEVHKNKVGIVCFSIRLYKFLVYKRTFRNGWLNLANFIVL